MTRMVVLYCLLIALALYAGLCLALYLAQERLIFYPEALPADYQFRFAAAHEELSWQAGEVRLHALYFRREAPRGAMLYLHGNAGSLRVWGELGVQLLAYGYDVLMPDYRGYGKSGGRPAGEATLLSDALLAYDELAARYPEERIVLYGRSLGSGIATYLAAERNPRMLLLETPYLSLAELARRQFPLAPPALLKYPLRSDRWIGRVRCPVYLFHGTADEVIPYESSLRLLPLIPTPHRLVTVEGGGHNNLAAFPAYQRALAEILGGAIHEWLTPQRINE